MLGTYASAALICAASLLVGRALLSLAGRREWSWLEPAVGFGAVITVTGLLARAPGHGTTRDRWALAAPGRRRRGDRAGGRPPTGAAGALARRACRSRSSIALVLTIPFAVSGRWGLLGVGFNNDLGLHLAWAEWLRSGFGPVPGRRLPARARTGWPSPSPRCRGSASGQAFVGEIFAIGILTGLTALAALREPRPGAPHCWRRRWSRVPYLAASYFAQGAFKETAEALFVLAFALALRDAGRRCRRGALGAAAASLLPCAGAGRRRLLLLQLRRPRLADRDRRRSGA